MSKVIKITEADLRRIITEKLDGEVNEDGIIEDGIIGTLLKSAVKSTVRGGSAISHHLSSLGASDAIRNLFAKAGKVSLNDFVLGALRPVQNEYVVILKDVQKLSDPKLAAPLKITVDPVASLKRHLSPQGGFYSLASPKKGSVVDLGYLWSDLHEIQSYHIPSIERNTKLSPNGKFVVNEMKKNVQDALTSLGTAMSQIAVK